MSLRLRVFFVFLFVIAATLLVTIGIVHRSIEAEGKLRIAEALQVGEKVFIDKLNTELENLERNSRLIANDDALRQAVFDDERSLQITLGNFLSRLSVDTGAEFMWMLDADANIISTAGTFTNDKLFPHYSLLELAEQNGWSTTAIAPVEDKLYKLSVVGFFVPVQAPLPSFWLVTGSTFDNEVTRNFATLTELELVLLDKESNRPWSFSTDITPSVEGLLSAELEQERASVSYYLNLAHGEYLARKVPLPSAPDRAAEALLMKSSEDITRQLNRLNTQLSISAFAVLVIATIVTAFLSRSITQPLLRLVQLAQAIGRGQYKKVASEKESKEIRTLANAFELMQNSIEEREKQIQHVAYHDGLTTLPNRTAFVNVIEAEISNHSGHSFAVCVLDFDRFKEINDTLGHHNGDRVLCEFAERLTSIESRNISIARLGGDEFGILVKNATQLDCVFDAIDALCEKPIELERIALEIHTSVGISLYPDHGQSPNALLQTAEIAMYSAKEEHKKYLFYDKSLDRHSVQRLTLISELKSAIDAGQLELHYQPKLCLKNSEYHSVECLVRWVHPRFGFINPEEFIGYAEQTGVIKHLTRWVVHTALAQAKDWRDQGLKIKVAINISAIDLSDTCFPDFVLNELSCLKLPNDSVALEITESAVMRDVDQALMTLQTLSDSGITLSIDDYGQGYSSMAQLKSLPVQELKIDKAFVLNLTENSDDFAIVKSTIELAHNMGLHVVAEGVENQKSLNILESYGCEYAQGFYLSRPLSPEKFTHWIQDNSEKIAKL